MKAHGGEINIIFQYYNEIILLTLLALYWCWCSPLVSWTQSHQLSTHNFLLHRFSNPEFPKLFCNISKNTTLIRDAILKNIPCTCIFFCSAMVHHLCGGRMPCGCAILMMVVVSEVSIQLTKYTMTDFITTSLRSHLAACIFNINLTDNTLL